MSSNDEAPAMRQAPTVLFSVGDASGDPYGAELVRELQRRHPQARFLGLGGTEMEKAGVELVVHQHELAVGGIVEVAASLGRVWSGWRRLGRALDRSQPDLVVLIDSADFNVPFARRARRSGAPVLYYILPQVWAWRRGRIRKLARRSDRLAVIFPFEVDVYRDEGVRVDFVGHPLVDAIADYRTGADRAGLRRELGLPGGAPAVALLPGSRRNELAYQLPLQLAAARALREREPTAHFVLALAPSLRSEDARARVAAAGLQEAFPLRVVQGRTYDAITACDAALAKPGTVTVETALLGRPLVVAGRGNPLSAAILRRLVDVPAWAMPNLITGEQVVPEFLQEAAKPEVLAEALVGVLQGAGRERQLEGLRRMRDRLGGGGATARVAALAEAMLGADRA